MITVRVPATSANLGPGFDCIGIALQIYGRFSFEETESGLQFAGEPEEFQNAENPAIVSYRRLLSEIGVPQKGLFLGVNTDIPIASGLGSSASLIAAGLYAANEAHGSPLPVDELVRLATQIEGHPDNVAPALLGGLVASACEEDKVLSACYNIHGSLRFTVLLAPYSVSTPLARSVLPVQIPRADAVFNTAHTALLLKAMEQGDTELLHFAAQDRLHQQYRAALIPEYALLREQALASGACAFCISGAGPTLLAIHTNEDFAERMKEHLPAGWRLMTTSPDNAGTQKIEDLRK